MLFFGHIAIAAAVAERTRADARAAIAGNLLPDLMDKTGAWVLRVMPSGRWLGHGLPFLSVTAAVARVFMSGRHWRGFMLGYVCHLAADHWAGGRLPWLAPFRGRPPGRERDAAWLAWNLVPEVLGLAYLLLRRANSAAVDR